MLTVEGLVSGYGNIVALHDASFGVGSGQVLALIGPNGAGKSTAIMTIAGLVRPMQGRIQVAGRDLTDEPARARVKHGVSLVPEGRRVFPDLTVNENLTVGAHHLKRTELEASRTRVVNLFPRLGERAQQPAGLLSGGEQQMLAIGRAIMSGPRLILIDELSLGLMPKIVTECYAALRVLQTAGLAIVVVEQNTDRAVSIADHVVVLDSGHVAWSGTGADARARPDVLSAHF